MRHTDESMKYQNHNASGRSSFTLIPPFYPALRGALRGGHLRFQRPSSEERMADSSIAFSYGADPWRGRRGFALIVTLTLMLLLSLLAVGMLTLSSVTLRGSRSGLADATARANARLAMQIAIGELQKNAGADRRVTATADIRNTVHADKLHWTGVWNTQNWKVSRPTTRTFVAWLASDPALMTSPGSEIQADSALSAASERSRRVSLVGAGTLGTADAANRVDMMTVPITSGADMTGGYAYWVGDEGVKARYDMTEPDPKDLFVTATRWGAPAKSGIQKIPGMESYAGLADTQVANALSFQTVKLAQHSMPRNLYHHITTDSVGLPVDVRLGGPKQDLSLAFELPLADFNSLASYHLDKETNSTGWYDQLNSRTYNRPEFYPARQRLGYLFMIPADTSGTDRVRGPTWDLLRNHYRLYKKEWEALSWPRKLAASGDALEARGSLPFSYACSRGGGAIKGRFSEFSNEAMWFGKSMKGPYSNGSYYRQRPAGPFDPTRDVLRRTAEKITPLVTRVTFVFGLVRGTFPFSGVKQETVAVSVDPYITILNPYNKPIEFASMGLYSSKFNPFIFHIDYTDATGAARTTEFRSSNNYFNQGSLSFRLNPASTGGKMRLEPGELRVISPDKVIGGMLVDRAGATPLAGTATYSEDSGIVVAPPAVVIPRAGSSVSLSIRGRDSSGYQEGDSLTFSMFYPKLHGGESRDVVTDLPPVAGVQTDRDSIDDPLVLWLGFATYPGADGVFQATRTIGIDQIPVAGQAGQFVAAFDIWMKDFRSGDVPVLAQFNPRATVLDPRDYDGSNRVSPGWDARLYSITDISVLNLVTAAGQGRWGGGINANANSPSYVCLYDIPSAPLTSLAQLQHADIGALGSDAPYAIGNSFPPPALPLRSLCGQLALATQQFTSWGPQTQADLCWAANEMIWDRYFFSGLNWGDSANPYQTLELAVAAMSKPVSGSPFANPRVGLWAPPATADVLKQNDTIGDHLVVRGAFNINSTSETAWKAVLAGLDQSELVYRANGAVKTGRFTSPVSRFSTPAGDNTDRYRGFASLSDTQLDALAKAIVAEIRSRGPFMGLSDFVNRRLDSTTYNRNGTLQAAIDAAGINSSLSGRPGASNLPNRIDSTQAGLPGYVTQADVLSSIGSFVSARSDTFKIRAYGEATDANGKVISRAWCEAVVQRTPDWILPTDVPATIANSRYPLSLTSGDPVFRPYLANSMFPAMNQYFGRRFQIVQFRWLAPGEV